jgi:hypothetical protein
VVSTGTVAILGQVAATLADAALSASGAIEITGAVSATLGDATLSATGFGAQVITGELAITLADATLAAQAMKLAGGGVRRGSGRQVQNAGRRNVQTARRA